MPNASRPAFLRSFGLLGGSRRAPDLADMGTTFALDEALDRDSPHGVAVDETAGGRPAARVTAWRLWLRRKRA